MTGAQYRHLKRLAHGLKPVVMVGRNGVTATLLASLDEALTTHELIKVRFVDLKDQRKPLTEELARASKSEVVGLIGNVATLFRQNEDPEKRKVTFDG